MTDFSEIAAAVCMQTATAMAEKLGMEKVEDWGTLQDGQHALVASPTGFLELGEVETDTRYIHSFCWVIYRLHGSERAIYQVMSEAFPQKPADRKTETRSLLPEGTVLYLKQGD